MSRPSVLLVDDEAALRAALAEALALEGFDVEEAGSVEDAVAASRARSFDSVVTDLRLPDGSGLDLLERMRSVDARFRAIVATGFGTYEVALQAIRLRVAAFLAKPFSFGDLLHALRSAHVEGAASPSDGARRTAAPADARGVDQLARELDVAMASLRVAPAAAERARVCAREALANAAAHAYPLDGGAIELSVARESATLAVAVADRGCGFDVSRALAEALEARRDREPGLIRIHRDADETSLRSRPGHGTEVRLRFHDAFDASREAARPAADDALPMALLWS